MLKSRSAHITKYSIQLLHFNSTDSWIWLTLQRSNWQKWSQRYSPEATPKLSSNQLILVYFLINVSWEFHNSPGLMLTNRQRRTIPNLLVTSLAVTALCLGGFVPAPLGHVGLATSKWPFNNLICQFQGLLLCWPLHRYTHWSWRRLTGILEWLNHQSTAGTYFLNV